LYYHQLHLLEISIDVEGNERRSSLLLIDAGVC